MDDNDDAITISDGSDDEGRLDRRAILAPAIHNVIAALGGYDADSIYVLGDEAYGCLKDLKKFWRKDDTDDERTVARIFFESRVLVNDLVPIILETAGKGAVEHKCAIACADLVTAMTWPIDVAEELKELDEEHDKGTDYTQLIMAHLHYKAALLRPGVIRALLGVIVPCLAKEKKERKERDTQIINVVLHLFRNLAFIRDLPPNMHASSDQAEFSTLQSKLIETLSEAHVLDLLVTIASNASTDTFLNGWNTLVLEIFYLLFRGVKPATLSVDQAKRPHGNLSRLLEAEDKIKRENARTASSRHSRFGTTLSVTLNPNKKPAPAKGSNDDAPAPPPDTQAQKFVLHRQQAISKEAGSIFDLKKKTVTKKGKKVDELGHEDNLHSNVLVIMQNLSKTFIESCFNPFLSSLLKDIKSERPKITEKDNLRLLFVTKWFMEFFLTVRNQEKQNAKSGSASSASTVWEFDLVAEVTERGWIVWVLRRMRGAVEEKPKMWTELQAGIECLTQLLLLIDTMSSADIADPALSDAAELLQQQLVYNGEVLDIAVDSLRAYKEGVQSLTYLDSSVHMSYALLRMLEKWAKARGNGEVYVRKRAKARRRKNKDNPENEDVSEEEDGQASETERMIHETMFTFDAFEAKFAGEDITQTLMAYLARYNDFTTPDQMKRVVNLLHRQAVKAKAEGLFFKVSTLNLFRTILAEQRMLPKDQPYKDLINLITYILKKFFKAVKEDPLVIVEAFYPKNRGRWKQFSSWEPEAKEKRKGREVEDTRFPPDVQIKKGYSWSEQLGIAIACLVEDGQEELISWAKEILSLVIAIRQRIVEETDGSASQANGEDMDADDEVLRDAATKLRGPSNDALAKFEDYLIPYVSDEHADAATKNSKFKLLLRLIQFHVLDDNADELEWYIPAAILPADLQRSLNVTNQFLLTPLDLAGGKASQLLSKKARRRRRVVASDDEASADGGDDDDEPKKKKAKKIKEKQVYKSAQFIEDSDVEIGDDDEFWAKEKALREKNELLAADGHIGTMRSTGTKKRKKTKDGKGKRKKRKGRESELGSEVEKGSNASDSEVEPVGVAGSSSPKHSSAPRPKPRPKPRPAHRTATSAELSADEARPQSPEQAAAAMSLSTNVGEPIETLRNNDEEEDSDGIQKPSRKGRGRMVISDDEDD